MSSLLERPWHRRKLDLRSIYRGGLDGFIFGAQDPNVLLMRRNLLLATATMATQSVTTRPVAHTISFTGTGTITLSGASTAGPLVGTGASNRVSLAFTPTAASLTMTVTGSVTLAQLERGSLTEYQPVTDWTTEYTAAVGALVQQWQESTGVTPVMVTETACGLRMDNSRSLVRGVEKLVSGDFSSGTGWTPAASWTISGGVATSNGTGLLTQTAEPLVIGRTYEAFITVTSYTSGTVYTPYDGTGLGQSRAVTSVGTFRRTFVAADEKCLIYGSSFVGVIDNVSVREVPGNHALQSTAAARPTVSARINLLLSTDTLATQSVTVIAAPHVLSFTGTGTVTLTGTSTAGPLVGTGANDRVSLTFTPTSGSLTLTVSGSVTLADLRLASDALFNIPAYQYVNTPADYQTDGFSTYERFDGTDDSRTSATGGGSTTAWFDCRLVTVLGGAGTTRVHWSDAGTNTGIEIGLDTNNKAYVSIGNGAARIAAVSANACALGSTYLLTRWYDGTNGYVQVNDEAPVASAAVTLSAGTAGFTVGKTNGAASNFFNGRMYGAVGIKNGNPTPSQREQIKREIARQARFVIP